MKLMMLGETTGNKRSNKEYDFLGTNASRFLWIELAKYDLYREDFYTHSIFGNKGHKKKYLTEEEYRDIQINLSKEIMMLEPELTLSVGRLTTEELLQKKLGGEYYDITGEMLYSTNYGIWFVPTIHPSTIARNEENLPILQNSIANFYDCYRELLNENS
jgi:uracil-DNA glycosylase family 4